MRGDYYVIYLAVKSLSTLHFNELQGKVEEQLICQDGQTGGLGGGDGHDREEDQLYVLMVAEVVCL